MKARYLQGAALGVCLTCSAASALTLSGRVLDETGSGVPGFVVAVEPVQATLGAVTTSVFTDAQGRYAFPDLDLPDLAGAQLRAWKAGYAPVLPKQRVLPLTELPGTGAARTLDLEVASGADTPELLSPSAWLSRMPDTPARHLMLLQCTACHQLPAGKFRSYAQFLDPQPPETRVTAWQAAIKFMRVKFFEIGSDGSAVSPKGFSYNAITNAATSPFNPHDEAVIAPFLAQHMPTRYDSAAGYQVSHGPVAYGPHAVIREIQLPQDSFVREVALTPASPYLWGADLQRNRLYRVDPNNPTDQQAYPVPLKGPSAPHTVNDDAQGYIWEAGIEGDHIARLDPRTGEWKMFNHFGPGSAAHDIALNSHFQVDTDPKGRVWATLIGNNRLGAVNVQTGATQEFEAPLAADNSTFRAAIYGLTMDSRKRVWYSQLTGGVGVFDTATDSFGTFLNYEEGTGPRRMAIDTDDILYVPLFGSGQLSLVDTKAEKEIARVDLPDRNAAPYSAVWDPWRNAVWLGNSNADAIYKFDCKTRTFSHIPLPRQMGYLRMITFDRRTGHLWTSYSNIPTGAGPSMFVEIDPDDGITPPPPALAANQETP